MAEASKSAHDLLVDYQGGKKWCVSEWRGHTRRGREREGQGPPPYTCTHARTHARTHVSVQTGEQETDGADAHAD